MLEMFQVVQDSSAMAGVGDKSAAKPVRKYDLAATDREIHKSRPEAKTIFEALQELYPNCTYTQGCDYLDPTQTDFAAALAAAESAGCRDPVPERKKWLGPPLRHRRR